jgi:ketosteroid isomerase-like protein
MKKVSTIAAAVLAVCLLAVPLASARGRKTPKAKTGNAGEQIKALQARATEAQLKADTSFFQKYYADDIVVIHGTGAVYTKAQEIADLKSGSLKYESIEVRDRKVRIYGNTAVVNLLASAKGLLESKPFNADFRVTWIWVKLGGNWKCVSRQVTKIPPKA